MTGKLQFALREHQNGNLDAAQQMYREVLAADPDNSDANHFLGLLLHNSGEVEAGLGHVIRSLLRSPSNSVYLNNLATLYLEEGKFDEAEKTLLESLRINRRSADALNNLAKAQYKQAKFEQSVDSYRRSLTLEPSRPETLAALSGALLAMGRFKEAETAARKALAMDGNLADAHANLGRAFFRQGLVREAIQSLERSCELAPDDLDSFESIAEVLASELRVHEAEGFLREVVDADPDRTSAIISLASALFQLRRHSESFAYWSRVVEAIPDSAVGLTGCGTTLSSQGLHDEAAPYFLRAIEAAPDYAVAYTNYFFSILHSESMSPIEAWNEFQKYSLRFDRPDDGADAIARASPTTERRLRVGFVSGDLREHPVAHFFEPTIENLDRTRFETFAYHTHPIKDEMSARLGTWFAHWVDCDKMSDDEMARQIKSDQIDILFDLSGHTAYNRLPVFGRRAAPIQITWIGFAGTTGLRAMDYRITEARFDPPGLTEHLHSETLVRMNSRTFSFSFPADPPDVGPPPVAHLGQITFGCLNNPAKISRASIRVWAEILRQLPSSRIILSTGKDRAIGARILDEFSNHHIERDRIVIEGLLAHREYLAKYNEIDIALDSFPYNGGTTSLHVLFMGVPLIALEGKTTVARLGAGFLQSIGLTELVAKDEAEYVRIACQLAADTNRLASYRTTLRAKLLEEPEADPTALTRELEQFLFSAWNKWAESTRLVVSERVCE